MPVEPPASPAPTITMPPPPAAEAPATGAPPATPAPSPVDLLSSEGVPSWVNEFDGTGAPDQVTMEELEALPMEAKRIIHHLTQQARAKAAEVGSEKANLAGARAALEGRSAQLSAEQTALWKLFGDSKIAEALKPPDGEAPDPFTVEGIQFLVKKHTAEQMKAFVDSVNAASGTYAKAHEDKIAADSYAKESTALDEFMGSHPDFMAHGDRIEALVKNHGLRFDTAYMLAAAEALAAGGAKPAQPKVDPMAAARRAARLGSQPPGAGVTATALPDTSEMNIIQIADYLEKHPEAQQYIIAQGTSW